MEVWSIFSSFSHPRVVVASETRNYVLWEIELIFLDLFLKVFLENLKLVVRNE